MYSYNAHRPVNSKFQYTIFSYTSKNMCTSLSYRSKGIRVYRTREKLRKWKATWQQFGSSVAQVAETWKTTECDCERKKRKHAQNNTHVPRYQSEKS